MNKLIVALLGNVGWIKRQALKFGGYIGTAVSSYLLGKLALAHQSGLLNDDQRAQITQGIGWLEIGITTGVVILAEIIASYFAKGRKE